MREYNLPYIIFPPCKLQIPTMQIVEGCLVLKKEEEDISVLKILVKIFKIKIYLLKDDKLYYL